jgi:uncharacterized membrane protein YdjX (TVP38/TMEM64 family)
VKALRPLLLVAGLLAAGMALRVLGLHEHLPGPGEAGPGLFLLLATIACAVGLPRQVVAYAAGLAYGFWSGIALTLVVEVLACVIDFYWARLVARDWARRRMQRMGGRLARLDAFLAANPFGATLTLRLLPVGSNIVLNLLAGVSGVAAGPFVLASAIGYVPQTVVFTLLGGGVRVGQGVQLVLGIALFAASALLGLLLMRRHRRAGLEA